MRRPPALLFGPAIVLTVGACSDSGADVAAVATSSPSTPVDADMPWHGAVLAEDGMTLELSVGSRPAGDGPCEQQFEHAVTETDELVTIAFDQVEPTTTTTDSVACTLMAQPQRFDIDLQVPLGDRDVHNGIDDEAQPVWRRADVVEPTVLPDGVTHADLGASPNRSRDGSPRSWSQHADATSGPGWDLWIDQQPAGSFMVPKDADVVSTTTVHGTEATIYEYFNHTGHMIHWTENGVEITVRAELHTVNMSEPLSFANPDVAFIDDVLIQVADGIAVP